MTQSVDSNPSHHLNEGDNAPDFVLPSDSEEELHLAKYRGDKNVIVYFYPKDDTPGCTMEAKDFRDNREAFDAKDTVIIGVSKDSVQRHCKFIDKYDLNFALASDVDGEVCEAYGVWKEKQMMGKRYMGIERSTFLIDKDGVVNKVWRKVKVKEHVAQVLAAVEAL